jgi:hypothetical protein
MKQQLITRHSTDDLLRPHAAHSTQLCAHCSCSLAGVVLLSSSRSLPTLIDSHYTYVWLDAGCWMEHAFPSLGTSGTLKCQRHQFCELGVRTSNFEYMRPIIFPRVVNRGRRVLLISPEKSEFVIFK